MIETHGPALRPLARALADQRADPILLFVEGVAGGGKSHLLRELAGLPGPAGAARLWWRCGVEGGQPDEDHRRGTALWLIDDVHRADAGELRKVRRVLEALAPGSAAAVTYRPEELPLPGLPLGGPPVAYPSRLTVLRHRLEPWPEERVRRAAEEALGGAWTAEAVRALHESTGGVAQVVVDVLGALREQEPAFTGTVAEVQAAGPPTRLTELVLSRTHDLPPAYRPVVWAAAVLDEPAGRDELIAVSGLGTAAGGDALLGALQGAALAEQDGRCRYGFAVPLAAAAVRATLAGPVRQDLHGRAAAVLSRRRCVPWATVAEHHRTAGDTRRWLRCVEKAAEQAAAAGRHQQAVTLLERTLASSGLPSQIRARLASLLARSAVNGLRSDQTVEVLTQIVRDASLPPAVRGELRLDLGLMLCNQLGLFPEGWRELETAAAELREVRPDLAARAMAALVLPYWPGHPVEVHREWLIKATAAADDADDAVMRTAVLANRAYLATSCADPDAWELVERLPTSTDDPARAQQSARGLCNAADSAVWLGFHDRADALLAVGDDLSARSGAPYIEHTARGARLFQEWWTGRWSGLAGRCEDFVAATADMPVIASEACVVRGLLALAQGDWAEATSWLSQRGTFSMERLPVPLGATAAGAMIRVALARREVEAAAEQARTAWTVVAEKGVWPWASEIAPWTVEALAASGDRDAAHIVVRRFAQGLGRSDAPAAVAALAWSRAVLAETEAPLREERGEPPRESLLEAAKLYREAAAAYEAMPRPYAGALMAERAARCLFAAEGEVDPAADTEAQSTGAPHAPGQGDPTTAWAITELESCTQRFTDLGAVWDAARVRALLRTRQPARKGRPPGRPSHTDELSPREAEVARLAVSGLTNREIAATLHLSPRTVEQHIARAMRKTGALSRRDLAPGPERTP
ncbi:helix-turn-helix transcriptional regulator [Streptomyces zaomyceticus]|uniref:helix-turn-helix transcriptional regulator n=1 Tax=Streptomyces zaomyceticus TaxID=68286 RepID=UPI0016727332|nr:helix-turn-helix transcriptional regulator [Streptomyces zaomyceticus]GHG04178.1 helix-turn-helix transcriptional regulator [Streptomyces zaomyceticus]